MKKTLFLIIALIGAATHLAAQDLRASLPSMPPLIESPSKGVLVDLVKAMGKVYTGGKISIEVFPFIRALKLVSDGDRDFELPLLVNPNVPIETLSYRYSTEKLYTVVFVLYTKKDSSVDIKNLQNYQIETDSGHVAFFPFPTVGGTSAEVALQKLAAGRIDGYLFAQVAVDPVATQLNLQGKLKKQFYKEFEVRAIVAKGAKGDVADKAITDTVKVLRNGGEYDKIMAPFLTNKFTADFQ